MPLKIACRVAAAVSLVLALVGCALMTPRSTVVALPVGVWTTRPVPCVYEEVAVIWVEGFTAAEVAEKVIAWLYDSPADALIDYRLQRNQASQTMGLFSVSALAVKWVGESCPTRPATLEEAMEARKGISQIIVTKPAAQKPSAGAVSDPTDDEGYNGF